MTRFVLPLTISLAAISLAIIAILVFKGIEQPQNATPSKASGLSPADPSKCQGNTSPSAKCFDCHKDATDRSQVNTLDFSCFAKFYGKSVGAGIAPSNPPPVTNPPANQITKKIQILIFNPTMPSGQKLIDYQSWNNPDTLTAQLITDFREVSAGYVNYQVVERVEVNNFGQKADGFNYTPQSYLQCWNNRSLCHNPDGVDYLKILAQYQSCEKRNNGTIDEVWLWGGPYFGYWESHLVGPNSFAYNSPPETGGNCRKLLPVMGFNYERGAGEAIESYGHRVEAIMTQVYGGKWDRYGTTPWDIFTRIDKYFPNQAQCGAIHFAPASTSDYDWGNTNIVKSACDDWLSYPNLSNPPNYKDVSCSLWNCDGYQFKKWWLKHLPKTTGKTNGKLNNWWSYIVDYDNAINQ